MYIINFFCISQKPHRSLATYNFYITNFSQHTLYDTLFHMYAREDFDVVIGMEFHVQVKSKTKLFSRAPLSFAEEVNANASTVDAGMPGALPSINKKCVEYGIATSLALNMHVDQQCSFDRKHYSYPDLPTKYQITQFFHPVGRNGELTILGRKIRLERLCLEADAAKNIHIGPHTYVDLNRCGTPLMEIVSQPDLRSEKEAVELYKRIRSIVRYVGSSDADMEKGQMRADVNISINLKGATEYGTRVEVKNMNSMNFVQQALTYEIERHIAHINAGKPIIMETRGYDPQNKTTFSMRTKETNADYRYMPDPDLPIVFISDAVISQIKSLIPELPDAKIARWINEYDITAEQANILSEEPITSSFFDSCANELLSAINNKDQVKNIATWMLGDFFALLNKHTLTLTESKISPKNLANLIAAIHDGKISGKQAKDVFKEMFETGKNAFDIIKDNNLVQITDTTSLRNIVKDILSKYPTEVNKAKAGDIRVFGFLVGQSMRATKGQANPELLNQIIKEEVDLA